MYRQKAEASQSALNAKVEMAKTRVAGQINSYAARNESQTKALRAAEIRQSILTHPERLANEQLKTINAKEKLAYLNNPEVMANTSSNAQARKQSAESNALKNEALLKKQKNTEDILDRASEYKALGDTRFAKKLELTVAESLGKGISNVGQNSKLMQVLTTIGAVKIASSTFNHLMGADVTAGSAMMQNPITGGYNYGSQVSGVMQAQQQRQSAWVGGATEGVAAGIALLPGILPKIAAGAIAIGGQLYNSYENSQTSLKAQAAQTFVNNTMNLEALGATNQAASGIKSGGNYRITDAEQPLIYAMKRGAAVYNRHFDGIQQLTDYAKATQMSISQAGALAGATAFLTKGMSPTQSKGFISGMEQSFSAYGVNDYAGTANTAIGMMQAGMSPAQATELAARSTGMSPGAQGAMSAYFGDTISGRNMKNYVLRKIAHVNRENWITGKGDAKASAYRANLMAHKNDPYNANPLAMFTDAMVNLTNDPTTSKAIAGKSIQATATQNKFISDTNAVTAQYAQGMSVDKAIGALNNELSGSVDKLSGFNLAVSAATEALNLLTNPVGSIKHLLSSTPSIKSGNTASSYGLPKIVSNMHVPDKLPSPKINVGSPMAGY